MSKTLRTIGKFFKSKIYRLFVIGFVNISKAL